MNSLVRLLAAVFVPALLLISCGPSLSDITLDLLQEGRNDEALARMRRAVVLDPTEPAYHRLMGIALYNKKQYAEAAKTFEKVLKMDEEDDQSAYYLAAAYEEMKEYSKAIQYYRLYTELTFYGEYKELVEARIKLLYRQQMEAEVQKALQMEQQLDVAKVPVNTLAVLYFENKGRKSEYDPLRKGLAEMLITDLSKVKTLRVVERVRLQQLVQELNLSETDLVDQKSAPRFGKLLGAYRLVKGSFFELTGEKMNIDAFVTRTRTGSVDATTNITGSMQEFFRMEKELVFKILDEMQIKLSDEERQAILEVPTENFFAFLQYSRGLELEDRGMYTQAYEAYSQAAAADPDFAQAKSSATSAKKAESIVGPTSSSGQNTQQQSGESGETPQSGTEKTTGSSPSKPTMSGPMGIGGPPPSSDPLNRSGQGSVGDRMNNTINNIQNTINPGTGSQTQPPPTVVSPLPGPPNPPGN